VEVRDLKFGSVGKQIMAFPFTNDRESLASRREHFKNENVLKIAAFAHHEQKDMPSHAEKV
jgi:hypothetical protein